MKKIFKKTIWSLMGIVLFFPAGQAIADTNGTNFEGFAVGEVHGQDGWTSGHGSSFCPLYDVAVVLNTYGYASFGAKSLRISNAITCGSFNDQTFSKSLIDDAGETAASTSTFSGGSRQPYFESQWDFASALPGSEQVGLSVVASANRGDTMRMSWVQMLDTPTGLQLNFEDYQHSLLNFVFTPIATGLDRTVPHTVKITMNFIDGASNDIVKVYLDGALIHTGTTWEDYYRDFAGGVPHPVDSILFRVAGAAAPANSGKGFLIDNFSSFSGPVPALLAPPAWNYNAWTDHGVGYAAPAAGDAYYPSVVYDAGGFSTGTLKYAMWYSDGLGSAYQVMSPDGTSWGAPTTMTGIAHAHHVQVLYDSNCFRAMPCNAGTTKYRMWFWDMVAPTLYDISSMATAESADGIHWINKAAVTQNPVVKLIQSPDSGTGWNRGTYGPVSVTYQPAAINTGTEPWNYRYVMYYNGTDGGHEVTGLAYSTDGLLWNAYAANPVLSGSGVGGSEAWDCTSAVYGTVFKNSLGYHFFYSGSGQDNGSGGCASTASFTGIGYASSADSKTWAKDPSPIFKISDGVAYRSGRIYTPSIIRDGSGILRMYFSVKDATGGPKKIGYATLIEPAILHVITLVVNGNGGTAISSDFSVHLKNAGVEALGSPLAGIAALGTGYALSAGTYEVSEAANAAYRQSFTGDCNSSGSVALTAGADKICTIINTDIPAPGAVPPPAPGNAGGGGNYFAPLPLINVTKIPSPLALLSGPGPVTYLYTVTNVGIVAMGGVWVKDNQCSAVQFISGDTNNDAKLDINETWTYSCTQVISQTTTNIATAHGSANGWDGYDAALATVVVIASVPTFLGAGIIPPLIKIVTVPSRLTPFPVGGGDVTYSYTVTNPGVVAMSDVVVNDDTCDPVSGPSGDTNGDALLNPGESWVYSCRTNVPASVADLVTAAGRANGLIALDYAFTDVLVAVANPAFPKTGLSGQQILSVAVNLQMGSRGSNVTILQQFLISQNKGPAAQTLARAGATAYFGALTRVALAEFQLSVGIAPALGHFGSITRAYVKAHY